MTSALPVVACGNAAEVLEPTEGVLDAVSLLVGNPVEAEGLLAVGPVRDDGPCAAAFQPMPQFGAVVSFVAEQPAGRLNAPDETRGGWAIVDFAAA